MKPVDWFESVGWASSRAWVAHCIFVDDGEIARLAEWGTGVAHCPSTCCLISEGAPPVATMRAAGVNVGLAVDGAGSEHASMWLEAHTALLLGRLRTGPTTMSARDVLEMATLGSARCLGRESAQRLPRARRVRRSRRLAARGDPLRRRLVGPGRGVAALRAGRAAAHGRRRQAGRAR